MYEAGLQLELDLVGLSNKVVNEVVIVEGGKKKL